MSSIETPMTHEWLVNSLNTYQSKALPLAVFQMINRTNVTNQTWGYTEVIYIISEIFLVLCLTVWNCEHLYISTFLVYLSHNHARSMSLEHHIRIYNSFFPSSPVFSWYSSLQYLKAHKYIKLTQQPPSTLSHKTKTNESKANGQTGDHNAWNP